MLLMPTSLNPSAPFLPAPLLSREVPRLEAYKMQPGHLGNCGLGDCLGSE